MNSDRAPSKTFTFGVVRDFTFTPLLTYLSVANVLTSYERGAGPASYAIRGSASIKSQGDLSFEDIFTGDQPAGGAAAYVAGPLTALLKNSGEPVDVEKIALTIDATEHQRSARIERVWLDTTRPRAGQKAVVHVALRSARGEEIVRQLPIEIPANLTGSLQLLVADAARTTADDRRETRGADMQRVVAADPHVQSRAPQQPPLRAPDVVRTRARWSTASRWPACRRRCWRCSRRIATAAPSDRCAA